MDNEQADNPYLSVETLSRQFRVKAPRGKVLDWLLAHGTGSDHQSPPVMVEGYRHWIDYRLSPMARIEDRPGPETVLGYPLRVNSYLINERGDTEPDRWAYRDYTPIMFWLLRRGKWTKVTAAYRPLAEWPDTAGWLRGRFDALIELIQREWPGDEFWDYEAAAPSQPGAADTGGATAVANQPGAGDGAGETAVSLGYIENKILEAYRHYQAQGYDPSDEQIAARLPMSRKGLTYSRETVNRKRNMMRKMGYEV